MAGLSDRIPKPSSLRRRMPISALMALATFLTAARPAHSAEPLSLDQAQERALASHPSLKAASLETGAAEADARAVAAFPDPEAGVEMENALGTGAFSGTRGLETTGRITQTIPLGSKRAMRSQAAREGFRLAGIAQEAARRRILNAIGMEFRLGLRAQAERRLAAEARQIDSASLTTALERRAAGKAPLLEEERARIALSQSRLRERETGRGFHAGLDRLARMIGSEKPDFDSLSGSLEDSLVAGAEDAYVDAWKSSPAGRLLSQRTRLSAAQAALAKAERIPDLQVEAGVRRSNEADATGFVFGIASPLPLWSRSAPLRAAELRVDKARADSAAQALEWRMRIIELHRAMASALETAGSLKDSTLPPAERAFHAAQEGFRMGRFSQLDVLDAEKTLFEIRTRYLDALLEFHRNRIALQEGPRLEQP